MREQLLGQAARLRAEVGQRHDDLARELARSPARAGARRGGAGLPGWWDLPPVAADSGARALAHGAAVGSGAAAAGRALWRAVPGLGLVYGTAVDLGVHDRPVTEAVLRNSAALGGGAAAVAAAGALAPAALAAAPVVLPVAPAAGVGLAVAAVVDPVVHRAPAPEPLDRRRPRPAPGPPPVAPGSRPGPPCPSDRQRE